MIGPENPVVWSFFTGAMGLDLGLEQTGWSASLAVEIEPKFCATIRRNRPNIRVLETDVSSLTADQLFDETDKCEVDLIVGGPPCQSFSPGGNRAALNDPRGNAIFEYLRLVNEVKPKYFILENVANLVTAAVRHRPIAERPGKSWNLSSYSNSQGQVFPVDGEAPPLEEDELSGSAIRYVLSTAVSELGYSVRFAVLDAADYGAPQKRLRFILIGARTGSAPTFIPPTHGPAGKPYVTVRDAIGDLVGDPGPGAQYTDRTRLFFEQVPPGGNWRDLPPDIAAKAMGPKSLAAGGGKTGFFRRLGWDSPSPTVTGKPNRKGSSMCHPSSIRPLSVRECARLQGFPDSWRFEGSMADQYLQIGNAVPVALGRAIGHSLTSGLRSDENLDHESMLRAAVTRIRASARNNRPKKLAAA